MTHRIAIILLLLFSLATNAERWDISFVTPTIVRVQWCDGDTHASWQSFRDQIPAGLNYMATGNPYWTVDVGSFNGMQSSRQFIIHVVGASADKQITYNGKKQTIKLFRFRWGST